MNSVFCRACRTTIAPTDIFCKTCGVDQRLPAQQPAPIPSQVAPPQYPTQYQPTAPPAPGLILDEYARQYKTLSRLQFFGWFFLFAYLLGLILVVYGMVMNQHFGGRSPNWDMIPKHGNVLSEKMRGY